VSLFARIRLVPAFARHERAQMPESLDRHDGRVGVARALAMDIGHVRGDGSRASVRQGHHEMKHTLQVLETTRPQQPAEQRVRRPRHADLGRQDGPELLQSVAISPGVGKTHLAIALGIHATEAGYRTYFTSAQDLVRNLAMAHLEGRWGSKMRTYTGPSVLVIDELGYLPMDQESAHWIFEVVTRRYEKGSIVLSSNRGFAEWGQVFADPVVASAILDRLLHHATVINIKGKSYRLRGQEAALEDQEVAML
jgi:hypothetical protein